MDGDGLYSRILGSMTCRKSYAVSRPDNLARYTSVEVLANVAGNSSSGETKMLDNSVRPKADWTSESFVILYEQRCRMVL